MLKNINKILNIINMIYIEFFYIGFFFAHDIDVDRYVDRILYIICTYLYHIDVDI